MVCPTKGNVYRKKHQVIANWSVHLLRDLQYWTFRMIEIYKLSKENNIEKFELNEPDNGSWNEFGDHTQQLLVRILGLLV